MSLATKLVVGLVTVWIIFYLAVYYVLLSPSSSQDDDNLPAVNPAIGSVGEIVSDSVGRISSFGTPFHFDSFESSACKARQFSGGVKGFKASVIIVTRNEKKENLLNTVQSVLAHSTPLLKNILIVDDLSLYPVSAWPEWVNFKHENLHIERTTHRVGVAAAKAFGAQYVTASDKPSELPSHMLVFLDSHSAAGKDWLTPLAATVAAHPSSIVYPAIDVIDSATNRIVRSSNVAGGFDWSLRFQWEDAGNPDLAASRLGFDGSKSIGPDSACTSPAAPGIFAITAAYFQDIGGLDTNLKYWGAENIELSLRVWMCGGTVIRQPCSRVAHQFDNLRSEALAGGGEVTVGEVDRNVLFVAEHWMDEKSRRLVYMKRFMNRMEYKVDISLDARNPSVFYGANAVTKKECKPFAWYLDQIYPGLKTDALSVEADYRHHLISQRESPALTELLRQYNKQSNFEIDRSVVDLLAARADRPEEQEARDAHRRLEPPQPKHKKVVFEPEVLPENSEHDKHGNHIRTTMICEDESFPGADCAARKANGDCENDRAYMIFGCPRTCGLCSADGHMCTNFYDNKCLDWKADNQCVEDVSAMRKSCKLACGFCHQDPNPGHVGSGVVVAPIVISRNQQSHADIPTAPEGIAYVAQRSYATGGLPDPSGAKEDCSLNGLPNGQLLARVDVTPTIPPTAPKVFCAIYTMEKNHATNVRATVSTWGKRCHGFVAFSTKDDHSIPAVRIEHEGEEAYDNMWQKSRSIWKYVAKNFMNDFDYFLLGGDDMFYIVENLVDYLASDEIKAMQREGKGMFLGRRFFPPKQEVFNSGGAGYILDKVSLQVLLDNLDDPKCFPHQKGFWEDVNVANCLRKSAGIVPYDTRDSQQRERFHPFTPGQHLTYRIPPGDKDWYPKYNPELKIGYDCCSDKSISFHYCAESILIQLSTYVYHCSSKTK